MTVPSLCFVCAGSLLVAASLTAPRSVGAVGGCIPGSYLAAEGSGTQSLLTFSSDGTFHLASSAERAFGFSHIQGTWQRQGAHDVRAVGLDFGLPSDPTGAGAPPEWITRIDMSLRFSPDCRRFAGDFREQIEQLAFVLTAGMVIWIFLELLKCFRDCFRPKS